MKTNSKNKKSFLVCYGKLKPADVSDYNYLIVEPAFYTRKDIDDFQQQNNYVLSYISLGEINEYATFFNEVKPFLLGKNNNWGSYYLNLEKEETQVILKKQIDQLIEIGYNGIFFDNLDNFGIYGELYDQKKSLIKFITTIFKTYPNKIFIQNAGLEFIDHTHKYTKAILLESVVSTYNFETKTYGLRSENDFENRKNNIITIEKKYKTPILLLEYANTKTLCTLIKNKLKHMTTNYYISTIDLQKHIHNY
jgi:uncharacterized protein (TIGR01370 family)